MVGSYMLLLCLYSSHLIIASAHNDLCLILNHIQIIKNFLVICVQCTAVLFCSLKMPIWHWKFYFKNLYIQNVYNGLFILIYGTSIIAYLCRSFFCSILFYSNFLYVCILLECCTYCIYWTLWSVTSSYCNWELMFYCFTVPTWNKVFLLLLLLLIGDAAVSGKETQCGTLDNGDTVSSVTSPGSPYTTVTVGSGCAVGKGRGWLMPTSSLMIVKYCIVNIVKYNDRPHLAAFLGIFMFHFGTCPLN